MKLCTVCGNTENDAIDICSNCGNNDLRMILKASYGWGNFQAYISFMILKLKP